VIGAALWSLVASSSLVVGALLAIRYDLAQRTIGLVMGFGAGVLIAVLSVDLAIDAFERSSSLVVAGGLLAGGVTFYAGDLLLDRFGGENRKSMEGEQSEGNPLAIVLGVVLDGIPESAAIGVALIEGEAIGVAFVVAVFLSNLPESLSASRGLRKAGRSAGWIIRLWLLVAVVCALAAMLAFGLLDESRQGLIAFTLAFAAGAILAMLADTMMPEAFEHAGRAVALVTVLGFALGFALTEREAAGATPASEHHGRAGLEHVHGDLRGTLPHVRRELLAGRVDVRGPPAQARVEREVGAPVDRDDRRCAEQARGGDRRRRIHVAFAQLRPPPRDGEQRDVHRRELRHALEELGVAREVDRPRA
jgi:ZIP family zinc transporter